MLWFPAQSPLTPKAIYIYFRHYGLLICLLTFPYKSGYIAKLYDDRPEFTLSQEEPRLFKIQRKAS